MSSQTLVISDDERHTAVTPPPLNPHLSNRNFKAIGYLNVVSENFQFFVAQ